MAQEPEGPVNGQFWAVVPAGGSGTRLWPLSRASRPKFLLPLTGGATLLQKTVARLTPLAPPGRTLVVCGSAHAAAIARQLPSLPDSNVLVEPSPRGSGPAIGLAAAIIARSDPGALMGSFAADHEVTDDAAFLAAVRTSIAAAGNGFLCTIGLTPTRPDTGYGYIERADEVVAAGPDGAAYRALRFVEKPDAERAATYVASGRYLWNASMFVWKVSTLLEEIARCLPDLSAGLRRISDAWGTPRQEQVLAETWAALPDSTVDQGIMERSDRVAVVPAAMGWSDIGDWHGLGELLPSDPAGNRSHAELVQIDSGDNVIWSETGRVIALIGLRQTVVVDTEDALLVIDRERAQEVKRLVELLKATRRDDRT